MSGFAASPPTASVVAQNSSVAPPLSPRSVNLSATAANVASAAYVVLILFALVRLVMATARTVLIVRNANEKRLRRRSRRPGRVALKHSASRM